MHILCKTFDANFISALQVTHATTTFRQRILWHILPHNAELQSVLAATLNDRGVAHVKLRIIQAGDILLILQCFFYHISQTRMLHTLWQQNGKNRVSVGFRSFAVYYNQYCTNLILHLFRVNYLHYLFSQIIFEQILCCLTGFLHYI